MGKDEFCSQTDLSASSDLLEVDMDILFNLSQRLLDHLYIGFIIISF